MNLDEKVLMFAHETGHNLNSIHDEDTKNCNKSEYRTHIIFWPLAAANTQERL